MSRARSSELRLRSVDWLIFSGVVAALIPLGVLAQHKGWIDVVGARPLGGGAGSGSGFGIGDEVFHPARYEAQLELDRHTSLPAAAPVAGDPDHGVYAGSVRIDLR